MAAGSGPVTVCSLLTHTLIHTQATHVHAPLSLPANSTNVCECMWVLANSGEGHYLLGGGAVIIGRAPDCP